MPSLYCSDSLLHSIASVWSSRSVTLGPLFCPSVRKTAPYRQFFFKCTLKPCYGNFTHWHCVSNFLKNGWQIHYEIRTSTFRLYDLVVPTSLNAFRYFLLSVFLETVFPRKLATSRAIDVAILWTVLWSYCGVPQGLTSSEREEYKIIWLQ